MPTTNLDVANGALIKLGESPISSLAGTSKAAVACNTRIEFCKRFVLRCHPWNFATKRTTLRLKSVTNAVNNGGEVQLTIATHGWSTGNRVSVSGIIGTSEANGTWTITVVDANNITLDGSVFANAYISGGVAGLAPEFDYMFIHAFPTDCIRVLMVDDGEEPYRVEGRTIVTDLEEVKLKYLYDVTDYDIMDAMFLEAVEYYLAWDISFQLTQSNTLKEQMWDSYEKALKKARFVSATEEPAEQLKANHFTDARISGAIQYVRDPMT